MVKPGPRASPTLRYHLKYFVAEGWGTRRRENRFPKPRRLIVRECSRTFEVIDPKQYALVITGGRL